MRGAADLCHGPGIGEAATVPSRGLTQQLIPDASRSRLAGDPREVLCVNPDLFFLVGLVLLALVFPALLAAFSSSEATFRPVIILILLGGGSIVFAATQNPQGYGAGDIPRIVMDLFR